MTKYTQARIEEIRGHLAELQRRRIPVTEFAREIGVVPWTIHKWKQRFIPSAATSAPSPVQRAPADLIEIPQSPSPGAIEIVVDDLTVRVPARFDGSDLERVLQLVRRC